MQFILHKSSWLSAAAFTFLLVSLWTVLAMSAPACQESRLAHEKQPSHNLTLPNIMVPVIRKEIRKEAPADVKEENKGFAVSRLPVAEALHPLVRVF